MADVDDYNALMAQVEALPPARHVELLEQAVRIADDLGYEDLGGQARLQLVSAYASSTSGPRIFAPFTWLLQRYELKRSWFDSDLQFQFLWQFKWMTHRLLSFPDVPLARIEENLASMYRIYSEAGEGLGPAHESAFLLARHVRGIRGAEREFETWLASERTHLSDCIACEPSRYAEYRAQQGRWQDSLDFAIPAVLGGETCADEPSTLYANMVEPLLMTGRGDEALTAHRRGWRLAVEDDTQVAQTAMHILTLARAGAIERGLGLLAQRICLLDGTISPYERMTLAAAATRLLDAASELYGKGTRTISYQQRDVSVDELRQELRSDALDLANRFDARNQTPEVGNMVWERYLNAPTLPPLPLPKPVLPPPLATPEERHPLAPDLRNVSTMTVDRMADLVELALRYSPMSEIDIIAREWRRRREQLPQLRSAATSEQMSGLASLEYLLAWSDPEITAARADSFVSSSADLYRAAGDEGEALLVEQWLKARAEQWDAAEAMLESIDAVGSHAMRGRARIRILQGVSEERRTELLAEVRALPCAVDSDYQLRRIWATAHNAGTDSPEELYTWTGQGLAILLPGEYSDTAAGLYVTRAFVCSLLGRPDEAATEMSKALSLAQRWGDSLHAFVLNAQARLALSANDIDRAQQLLMQAAALAERCHALDPFTDAKGILAETYREQGRLLEAAEEAESGLAALELARTNDVFLEPGTDLKQARLAALAAEVSEALDEPNRATSLFQRASELFEACGENAAAGNAWCAYARLVQESDSVAAVRAFRRAISLATADNDQRALMVARRQLPLAVQGADGLDAGLRDLDVAVALNDDNEARVLTDTVLREQLDGWNFEFERLDLRDTRARMYGVAERYEEGLAVLADVPERMYELGAENPATTSRLLRAKLLFSAGRIDDGIVQVELVLDLIRTWDDPARLISDIAGIGARALHGAGREAEAEAFWEKHNPEGN